MNPAYGLVQEKFDELIADRGKLVTWRAAYRCSCWSISSGAPNADCKACGGVGFLYQSPVSVTALIQGLDTKKDFLPTGEWRMGDMTCTVPNKIRRLEKLDPPKQGTQIIWDPNPMWSIGEWDLVTLPDSEQRTSEILTNGRPLWRRPADTLLHPAEAILSIVALVVADPVSGAVQEFTRGVEGTDFTRSGSDVVWDASSTADYTITGNVVSFNPNGLYAKDLPVGAQYSVTYTHLTTYIVYQAIPQARDVDGQHMPRKVILRLKDVGAQ